MELTQHQFNSVFGKRLRALRKIRRCSQKALCRKGRFHVNTVRYWETEKGVPSLWAYWKICKILEVPLDYFFEREEEIPEV